MPVFSKNPYLCNWIVLTFLPISSYIVYSCSRYSLSVHVCYGRCTWNKDILSYLIPFILIMSYLFLSYYILSLFILSETLNNKRWSTSDCSLTKHLPTLLIELAVLLLLTIAKHRVTRPRATRPLWHSTTESLDHRVTRPLIHSTQNYSTTEPIIIIVTAIVLLQRWCHHISSLDLVCRQYVDKYVNTQYCLGDKKIYFIWKINKKRKKSIYTL